MAPSDYSGRLPRTCADGLAKQPSREDAERADEPHEPPDLKRYGHGVCAGLAEDHPVQEDEHDGHHPDDHRDLAGAPGKRVPADDDPRQHERSDASEREQDVELGERLPGVEAPDGAVKRRVRIATARMPWRGAARTKPGQEQRAEQHARPDEPDELAHAESPQI